MTAQHTPPADHVPTMSDEEAIRLMRHWTEDALVDPARHSYFPSLVRMLFQFLRNEEAREALRASAPTPRPKSYEIQPVGIPDSAFVTLDTTDAYRVFSTLLDAIKAWDYSTDPLDDYAARARLGDLLDAVKIMNAGYMAAIKPGVQAHRDDEAAARAWKADRWMKRGELAQEARAAEKAQERQRRTGDAQADEDTAAAVAAVDLTATPTAPAATRAS